MKTLLLIVSFFLILPSAMANEKIRGNYDVLNNLPKKHSLKKVIFEEFMNFGCPHCNNFRNLSTEMKDKYKGRVDFVDIPILFRGQDDAPLRLYYVAKSLGKAEEIKNAIFEARFKNNVNVFDSGIINYLARSLGIGEEYTKQAQNPEITKAIDAGNQKADLYGVTATPTIVIAGALKMKIGNSMEDFANHLPETLDDLLQ
ncbi:MAG: DsbA family protein [SAR324 cluster bacterium]|nr:DsbA family protein [SAR324 cluster bacterium]